MVEDNYCFITKKLANCENALIMFVGDNMTRGENHFTSEETYYAEFSEELF